MPTRNDAATHLDSPCPLEAPLAIFARKWKPEILFHLFENKALRHHELRKKLRGVSQKVLTEQLRELERDGLVSRSVLQVAPPRVQYAATDLGHSIRPIFAAIHRWGDDHMDEVKAARISSES
ncbi:MAG: helix-turn-helix domain-containing protein [Planctomycetota bacterium]